MATTPHITRDLLFLEALPAANVPPPPADFEKAARAIVIDWRRKFLAQNKLTNTRMNRLLASYHASVIREIKKVYKPGLTPTEAQVQLLTNRIARATNTFSGNVRNLMQASVASAADITAVRESQVAMKAYGKLLPKDLAQVITDPFKKNALAAATLDTMWNSALGGSKVSLSKKVWAMSAQTQARVTGIVRRGIQEGVHPFDLADMLGGELISSQPMGVAKIWSSSSAPARLKKLVQSRGGTISYNHLRVARTEMMRAAMTAHKLRVHFMQSMPKALNPVIGIKWNLSASHPKDDICDDWAAGGSIGLPPGVYHVGEVPMGHPNDLCFTTTAMDLKGYKKNAKAWLLNSKTSPADMKKALTMSAGQYLSPRNRSMLAALANGTGKIPPVPMHFPKSKPVGPKSPTPKAQPKPKSVVSQPVGPPAKPVLPEPVLPGVEWQPSMPLGQATKFSKNSKITKSVYHGTPVHPEKILKTGLRSYADEVNEHAGISFSFGKQEAATYGRNVMRAKVHVRNPLNVSKEFWKGTSTAPRHQKVYAQLKKNGIFPRKATVGQMSQAIEQIGHDAWMTATELRVFHPKNATLVKPKVVPKKTKIPDKPKGPPVLDASKMKKVGPQKGSNLGGLYEDADGVQWYIKSPKTVEHAKNEVLANKLYKAAGVENVPEVRLATLDGKAAVASRIEEGLVAKKDILQVLNKAGAANRSAVMEGFASDAWLANWDVVGLQYDNLLIKKGVGGFWRIDQGGALRFRAQGGAKGSAFGNKVTEVETLLNPAKNPQSASTFRTLTYEEFKKGAAGVVNISEKQIDDLLALYGPTDPADLASLRTTLLARQQDMKHQLNVMRDKLPGRMVKGVDVPTPPVNKAGGGWVDMDWKKAVEQWKTKALPPSTDPSIVAHLKKFDPTGGIKVVAPKPPPPAPPKPTQITAKAAEASKEFVAPKAPSWWKTKAVDPSDDAWDQVVSKWMTGKPLGKQLSSTKTGYLTKWDKQWLEKNVGPKGGSVGKPQPPGLNLTKIPKKPEEFKYMSDAGWKNISSAWVEGEPAITTSDTAAAWFASNVTPSQINALKKLYGPLGSKRKFVPKGARTSSIDTSKKHWKWADDEARPWTHKTVPTIEEEWARLSVDEQIQLRNFTGGAYRDINNTLRSAKYKGKNTLPHEGTKARDAINAIEKADRFTDDNYVWRKFGTDHMGFSTRDEALAYFRTQIGQIHRFEGVTSTSYSPDFAFGWGYKPNSVVFEMKTRRGFRMATKSASGKRENELTLNHGTKYRVVDVKKVKFKDSNVLGGQVREYTVVQVEIL